MSVARIKPGASALVVLACAAALLGLSACSGIRDSLGLGKNVPDEFAVVPNAPLTLPPEYTLRPPEPGAPRPQVAPLRQQAAEAVFSNGAAAPVNGAESAGELALLAQAGALKTDPDIRRLIDREFSIYASEQDSFFEDLLFWRAEQNLGEEVDASAEARRLRENAALGRAVTDGESPTIQRRERALLEGIF